MCIDFEQQILPLRKRVYRRIYRMMANRSEAEDLTQETFVRAWANYATFDPTRSFDAWICSIANNLCIDQLRRRRRRKETSLETLLGEATDLELNCRHMADRSNDPERRLLSEEIGEPLLIGLQALPTEYRHCLQLIGRGYSYEQIADLLNCPIGTVRSRIYRARAMVREFMAARS